MRVQSRIASARTDAAPNGWANQGVHEMEAVKVCAVCSFDIDAQASSCSRCASRQPEMASIHRGLPGRLIGGVCTAIGQRVGVDVVWIRVLFGVLGAMSGGLVFWAYAMVWVATPPHADGRAPLGRWVDWLVDLFTPSRRSPRERV